MTDIVTHPYGINFTYTTSAQVYVNQKTHITNRVTSIVTHPYGIKITNTTSAQVYVNRKTTTEDYKPPHPPSVRGAGVELLTTHAELHKKPFTYS